MGGRVADIIYDITYNYEIDQIKKFEQSWYLHKFSKVPCTCWYENPLKDGSHVTTCGSGGGRLIIV